MQAVEVKIVTAITMARALNAALIVNVRDCTVVIRQTPCAIQPAQAIQLPVIRPSAKMKPTVMGVSVCLTWQRVITAAPVIPNASTTTIVLMVTVVMVPVRMLVRHAILRDSREPVR